MTPNEIEAFFTRSDGAYAFARWGRALAPIVFGVEDKTLAVVKGAIEAVSQLAGVPVAQTDPELGSNFMWFFFRDWEELREVPDLDRLIPDLDGLVTRLSREGANQYRIFRFDEAGAIRAVFVFLRMDADLAAVPADTLALGQVAQSVLLWSDTAFETTSPLVRAPGSDVVLLRPGISDVIRVAYDPGLPDATQDPAHALRIFARLQV